MKILAFDRFLPGITIEHVKPHLRKEAEAAWDLYVKGIFGELYFRQDRPGAVIIMECESIEKAREVLKKLPLIEENLIEFELIPLGAFIPFSILFQENNEAHLETVHSQKSPDF